MVQPSRDRGPVEPSVLEMLAAERRRLLHGLDTDERSLGAGAWPYTIHCPANAELVLQRAKQLLLTVNNEDVIRRWPSDDEWLSRLPDWFLAACIPPPTLEEFKREEKRRKSLTTAEWSQLIQEEKWSALGWVEAMKPGGIPELADEPMREWYWWDAEVIDAGKIEMAIDTFDMRITFPCHNWMFRSAGATSVNDD